MDEYRFLGVAVMGLVSVFFWLFALAVPLWLIRKFAPKAEWWFYTPLSKVIARLAAPVLQAMRAGPKRG